MPDLDLMIERYFNAPPARVFQMWAEAAHRRKWWAPKGFRCAEFDHDFQKGGLWQARLDSLETGNALWMGGSYREIATETRIVFDFAWLEAGQTPGHRSVITVTFDAEGDGTVQRFHQGVFENLHARDSHQGGWTDCLDRLAALFETG